MRTICSKVMSINSEIARSLHDMAELYAVKGDFFRSRAFMLASRQVESLGEDLGKIREKEGLTSIPSVGKGIAAVIEELLQTGESKELEDLKESLPYGLLDLMKLEGVGPKTALRLRNELGVTSVEELEAVLRDGKLVELKGFGPKAQENLLNSIRDYRSRQDRFLLGAILPVVDSVLLYMSRCEEIVQIDVAGSTRRRKETVGDLDLVAASTKPEEAVEWFVSMKGVGRIVSRGTTRSTIVMSSNLQVDLRVVEPEAYGAAFLYLTGSKEHNVKLRTIAIKKGYKLNEYGLFKRKTNQKIAGTTEEDIYSALSMSWIEPELREDRGELDAAIERRLPVLVTIEEIQGDLHVHSEWSDGSASIDEIMNKAKAMGLKYTAICDHSKSLGIARGLDEARLKKQVDEIGKINNKTEGFTVLRGIECDIRSDGDLDLPDAALKDLDFVVASIHSGFKSEEKQLTARMINAIQNDYVSAIGHPTGRIIQRRNPYALDLDRVFEAAADAGVMMEINAFPDRLDLNDENSRAAKEHGVRICIGTDAHSLGHMDFLPLGVYVARRGWLRGTDVVNTLSAKEITEL